MSESCTLGRAWPIGIRLVVAYGRFQMKSCLPFPVRLCVLILLAATATISGTAEAVVHDGNDILGLATTADETGQFSLVDPPLGEFDLHLLVYGFDHPQGIVGWECQILLPDGVLATGVSLEGKADPTGIDLETLALRAFPHQALEPVGGIVHLATLHLMLTDDSRNQEFLLAPYPDDEAKMAFSLETSGANVTALRWPDDCPDCPVFTIIASSQPTVRSTWGSVKSLYR